MKLLSGGRSSDERIIWPAEFLKRSLKSLQFCSEYQASRSPRTRFVCWIQSTAYGLSSTLDSFLTIVHLPQPTFAPHGKLFHAETHLLFNLLILLARSDLKDNFLHSFLLENCWRAFSRTFCLALAGRIGWGFGICNCAVNELTLLDFRLLDYFACLH